jgi:hypothetical protein
MLMQCASFRRGNLQRLTLLVGCLAVCLHPAAATTNLSTWVFPAASGRLLARPDFLGNRVIDASGVGYKGGTVLLPSATTVPIRTKGLSPWLLRPPQVVCRRGRRLSEHITGIGGALWDRSGLPSVLEPIALAQWFHLSVLSGKRRMAGSASSLDLPSLPPSILSDRGHHL